MAEWAKFGFGEDRFVRELLVLKGHVVALDTETVIDERDKRTARTRLIFHGGAELVVPAPQERVAKALGIET